MAPIVDDRFIDSHTGDVALRDGGTIRVRPILPSDKAQLVAEMGRLSSESRYRRFFSATRELPPRLLRYLTEVDYDTHFAWVAIDLEHERGVGIARYIRLRDDPQAAEVAVTVADDHHGRGIGTALLKLVAYSAAAHGVERLVATALADNDDVRKLLRRVGVTATMELGCGTSAIVVPLRDLPVDGADGDLQGIAVGMAGSDARLAWLKGPSAASTT